MRWSRNGSKLPGERLVLGFPNGVQALLDLDQLADENEDAARALVGASGRPRDFAPFGLHPANARALIAWHMAGLSLFGGGRQPSVRAAVHEAKSVALALAMDRKAENITRAALSVGSSRRAVRSHLQLAGLYDWARVETDDEGGDEDELGEDLIEEVRIDGSE